MGRMTTEMRALPDTQAGVPGQMDRESPSRVPVRILFVSHSPLLYGAELSLYELVKGLRMTRLVDPEVVFPSKGPLVRRLRDLGIRTWIVPFFPWTDPTLARREMFGLLRRNVKAVYHFLRLFRITKPTLIVTNTLTIPSAAVAAYLAGTPHLWYAHEYAVEAYGISFHWGYGRSLKFVRFLSDLVLVPSQALRNHLSHWIPNDQLRVLHYAIETPTPPGQSTSDRTRRPLRLVVIGHKMKGKRQEDAIRALAILRRKGLNLVLSLVGSGDADYVRFLRRLAEELTVQPWIDFVDFTENPFAFLESAHIALSCSGLESFGRVVVEAMRYRRPVIGARSGGTEELIKDGWNGLLYEPGNATDLAGRIEALYDDPELADRLASNAEAWARERFSTQNYTRDFISFASEVLRLRASRPKSISSLLKKRGGVG